MSLNIPIENIIRMYPPMYMQLQQRADNKYVKASTKMADRYNKGRKIKIFEVGDKISVQIPRIDRTNSDLPRLLCIVMQEKGKVQCLYRLRLATIYRHQQQVTHSIVITGHCYLCLPSLVPEHPYYVSQECLAYPQFCHLSY